MKKNTLLLIFYLIIVPIYSKAFGQQEKPRIGIAGIQIENSVFVPNRQDIVGRTLTLPDYLSQDSIMGQSVLSIHQYLKDLEYHH